MRMRGVACPKRLRQIGGSNSRNTPDAQRLGRLAASRRFIALYRPNTLVYGDCLQVLPRIPSGSVNFVLTDPPYIARYKSRDGRAVPNDDNHLWLKPAFRQMYRVLERDSFCVTFYGWPHADRFMDAFRAADFRIAGHLVFPKRYTSTTRFLRYQHECAYLLVKGSPKMPADPIGDVIDWTYSGNRLHPTQKPLSVLLPLIESFSAPKGLVLDPFAGSGSTLVAAQTLGRDYIGIELSAEYHAVASDRLAGMHHEPERKEPVRAVTGATPRTPAPG